MTSKQQNPKHRLSSQQHPGAGVFRAFGKRMMIFLVIIGAYAGFVTLASQSTGALSSIQAQSNPPKNVILLIGDGMSQEYLDAASIYATGVKGQLFMEGAPHSTTMTTHAFGGIITDSAAAASAMATGRKVFNGVISMGSSGEELETSLEHFKNRCKSTGLVGTSYINHATAGAFGAHAASRTFLDEIANDFFTQSRPNVLFGGAASGITPEVAAENGYTVVTNRRELNALIPALNPHVSGQFAYGHMGYEHDDELGGASFYANQPHLSEMARHAINLLAGDDDGFFLVIEGSRIDHAGHENNVRRAIFETLEFDNTVREVMNWAEGRDDTLVIATADHETGGLRVEENHGLGKFPTVRWSTFAHTMAEVPVFAWGPGAELVSGQLDNTDIHRIVTANSGVAPAACEDPTAGQDTQPEQAATPVGPTNTPTVTPTPTLTPTALPTATPTATPTPTPMLPLDIDVSNSPREWVAPGEEIEYMISYRAGNQGLEDITLFSRIPEGVELLPESVSGTAGETFRVETFEGVDTVEWRIGSLPANETGSVSYRVRRPSVPSNTPAEGETRANAIVVSKAAPATAAANQPVEYTLTLTNTTNTLLTDVFVVDAVPFGAIYLSGADAPPINDEVSWWIDQLQPNEVRTVSYTVMASTSLMTRGFKVFNPEGIGMTSYDVISTVVNNTPMPLTGDGTEIVNNGVWATWYDSGEFNVGRAEPIRNPTFDFYLPVIAD